MTDRTVNDAPLQLEWGEIEQKHEYRQRYQDNLRVAAHEPDIAVEAEHLLHGSTFPRMGGTTAAVADESWHITMTA